MCYEVLQEDRVTDRTIGAILELEASDAMINGLVAALVPQVPLWQGTPLWLGGVSAAAVIPLGVALHQLSFVVAVLEIRRRARRSDAAPQPPETGIFGDGAGTAGATAVREWTLLCSRQPAFEV